MEGDQHFDLVFIRHAESGTNKATEDFVNRTHIIYDWEHLSHNQEFLKTIKYSFDLLDAPITPQGVEQCKKARKELEGYQPDVILVSPLNRALMTCKEIFPEPTCPVIVEPILSEGLRSSCDFSCEFEKKKIDYPGYDFKKVEALGIFWVIANESDKNQAKYREVLQENKDKSFEETMRAIYAFMTKTFIYESPTNLRRRTERLKVLLGEYRKQYKSIVVVSHYNIIRFSLTHEFNEKDEPFHCHIGNCEVKKALVTQL